MSDIMFNMLYALSHGIPGLVVAGVALILMFLGLIRKEASLMVIAALLTIPSTYTAGDWTSVLLLVRLIPLFSLLSAIAISKEENFLAWILPFPSFGALVYFLFNLISSGASGL
jgi:hypothetical protein